MALTLRTGGGLLSPASAVKSNTNNDGKNNGGLIGGVGYLAEKSALGFLSSVEGIWDYSAGGVAKLFGVDQWAERQFANDWVDYTHADEWYDPGRGWQIAGDVSGGIGTSMPAIAGAAGAALITYFSGGTAAPAAVKLLSVSAAPLIAGLGAAGTATKEAYQKTGELGLKEFGYGALSGATEAALEGVTAGLGTGTGRIVSSLSKKAAGETVQTLSKSGAKSVIKHLAADFASEAVEEGLAEAIDPLYQKLTVDPNAKAATPQEIGYAALVGGLSGLVMSGGAATVNTVANLSSGNAAINSGNAEKIIKTASSISAYEDANDTGYESYKAISADYKALSESLSKTGGQISTAKQRMLLGSLKRAETAAFVEPFIERSAENLLLNADSAAERYSSFGMTDADGNQITVTADDIRSGVDADLIRKADSGKLTEAEQKTFTKQVRAAMRSNSVLTTLATMDATGRITMDTRKFAEAAREGAEIATAADINAFAETASQEEIRSLAADLGIDDWAALTPDEFREKTAAFAQSDRGRELSYQNKRIRAAMGIAEDSAVALPKAFSGNIAEGATRYRTADGIDMAIIREGDRNYIYNYESGDISRAMSEAEVNRILADYWSGSRKAATDARMALSQSEAQNNVRNDVGSVRNNAELLGTAATARYNMLASEHIKGWRQLSEPVKQAVRMTMRQAEAAGLSEDTAITFGRVAAHSGMNIVFDGVRSGAGDALQTGNTIYIDPNANKDRIEKRLLIHEMAHALIKRQGGMKLMTDAYFATDPAKAKEIEDRYIAYYEEQGLSEAQYIPIVAEEIAVAHLEDLLGREGVWDYMLADEPSLGEKVLSFFRGTARDYADDAGLSSESRKLLTMYRKMFREMAEAKRGSNAVELAERDNKNTVTSMNGKNMHVTDERYALVGRTEDGRGIYQSNYPENTPKTIKQNDIIKLVQNVWSKKPIKLDLIEDGKVVLIEAKFNPELTERSDLSKIAFGNRKGTASEKRITMNLSSDLYQIAEDSHYVGSKIESGKDNAAHIGVSKWHYFITNLVYVESDGTKIDCYMNIDVKQSNSGNWFYSFAIEKGSRPADVLSVVTDNSATTSTVSISESEPKVNRNSKKSSDERMALPEDKALDALLDERIKVQNRLAELRKLKKDIESSQEYNDIVSKIVNSEKSAIDDVIQEYNEWEKRSKYNEIVNEIKSLDDSESKLIRQYRELQEQKAVFDEQKNIETTGLSENEYFRKQAVKEFGYTPYFYDAGYMLQNGKLLNFSGEKGRHFGSRGEDHRAIGKIFANLNGGKALVKFMSYGNIRVMAETPGIDIFATEEPTSDQYSGIRKFVREYAKEGYFAVDITDENGRVIGTYSYENNINAERVVNDIKYYYQHGELREQSSIANFRYALPEDGGKKKKYHMSDAQLRADVANKIHKKAYSKADARETLRGLTGIELLDAKVQDKLATYLWQGFNTCETQEQREKFAKGFSEELGKMLYLMKEPDPNAGMYRERLEHFRAGIGRLTISSGQYAGDLMHLLDKDGYRSFRARWGFNQKAAKKGYKPYSVDKFVNDIAGELEGMAHLREMNPADAMIEIDRLYNDAKAGEKATYNLYTEEEAEAVMRGFENQILRAFDERGKQSVFAKRVGYLFESYAENAERMQAEFDEINGRNKILGMISAKAQKMKELKMGTYANATQMDSEVFKGSIETLAGIDYRGNLSVTKAKKALRELEKWYRTDNGMLQYVDEENRGFFDRGISEMLHELTETDEPFTKEQLSTLSDVMSYFINFVEKYGKIWRGGKWIDAKPKAEQYVNHLRETEQRKKTIFYRRLASWYMNTFGDPASVVRYYDNYQEGFYIDAYEELRAAALEADTMRMDVLRDYDKFMQEHPKYMREAAKQTVTWTDAQITAKMPKMVAIGLYMTSKREQAHAGLAINGFKFEDAEGKVHRGGGVLKGVQDPSKASKEEFAAAMEDLRRQLRQSFTEKDLEYIKILEKAYGYDLRSLKVERDMQRQGFTNATLDYYYPIRRADIAKSVDVSVFSELDRVSNASFNKNTVQGARGKLMIEDADALFHRHATAVTRYAALSPAIDNFNVLFNMDISGNPNDSVSVATVGEAVWKEAKEYFRDLIGDIQGKPKSTGEFNGILGKMRSGYAMYQLGANPKTWVTQLSSLFASTSILDADSIMKGLRYGGNDVDQYCKLAELRNYEGAAVKAQSVLDQVNRVGEVLMKPIGMTDRLVVRMLFGACQVQVQKDSKLKIGTEENKVAAGKLLEKVLFETQQNSLATERSAAMRSGSEFAKAITMFSADGMKMTGRVVDGFGEVNALREKVKTATGEEKDELMKQLKEAKKRCMEAVAAMMGSAAFGVAVAELFRHIYAKERKEDENAWLDMTGDFFGNVIGGLPLFRDFYSKLVDGYDMDNYTVSMMNDLFNSVDSALDLSGKIIKGESDGTDIGSWCKQSSYVLGQFTGIPVRNIYNVVTGLTRRFSPRAGYQIDRLFYSKNYRNDLKAAVEDGDVRMAAMLTGIIYGKDASGEIGDEGMEELNRLTMAGASVLPRTVSKQITVDGEEIELTKEQRTAITTAYEDGWSVGISELMNSPTYANMTDEQREDAIRKLYDIAYEQALLESGFDRGERSVTLASAVGISKAAVYYATVSGMEADVDRKGNKIEGSRRAKTVAAIEAMTDVREERLLLLATAGYSLQAGDFRFATAEDAKRRLLKYIINMKGLSAEERAAIAEMCGFEVKNGKVSAKSLSA